MNTQQTILICAGPSGGHLFPARAFAEAMRKRYPQFHFVLMTSRKGEAFCGKRPDGVFERIYYLPNFPAPHGFSLRGASFLIKLALAFLVSLRVLKRHRPALCMGFGGYSTYPGIVLSRFLKIPALIHEQNRVFGRATRRLMKHAEGICLSFPEEDSCFTGAGPVRYVTGLPLRRALIASSGREKVPLSGTGGDSAGKTVLVLGGSQGARRLNDLMLEACRHMKPEEKSDFAVIHITGKRDSGRVKKEYEENHIRAEIHPFFENMEDLYRRADLALTRGGANTLFELALFGVPAIVVPYPYAGSHQEENARYFEARKALICRPERGFTGYNLYETLTALLKDDERLKGMRERIHALAAPEAPEKLTGIASGYLREEANYGHE